MKTLNRYRFGSHVYGTKRKHALIQLFEEHHCYGAAVKENKLVDKIIRLVQTSY